MNDLALLTPLFPYAATVLGLILGSFYSVCVYRYLAGESIVSPGSHCPLCARPLCWYENVPLVSFLAQRGRCRGCGGRISPVYPAIEAVSALWSLALALEYGPSYAYLLYMAVGGIYVVASFIDLDDFILPDMLTYPAAAIALAGKIFVLGEPYLGPLIGAAVGAGSFWLLAEFYLRARGIEGLGLGDVKLMASIGALVGWQGLPLSIVLGCLAALLASPLFLRGSEEKGRTPIPFGPFLCLGAMLYVLYGRRLSELIAGLTG
jgi:leader peptidase (prepilin peptidase) / N-methyltransferase